MNLKYSLLSCFVLVTSVVQAQQEVWQLVRINSHVAIQLPTSTQELDVPATMKAADAPNRDDPRTQTSRAFRGEDKAAIYIVTVVPFSGDAPLSTDSIARVNYYKSRLIPMLMTRAHGSALAQASTMKNGIPILTVKYQVLNSSGIPVVKYMQTFTVKQLIYELFFVPKDGVGQSCIVQRNRFFNPLIAPLR